MKRSERILKHARREGLCCAMWLSVACASGVWAAVAWMGGGFPGGILLSTIAIAVLLPAWWHGGERRRLRALASLERQYEPAREFLPAQSRELTPWAVALGTLAVIGAITAAIHLI